MKNLEYDYSGIIEDLERYDADAGALGNWLAGMKPKRGHYQGSINSDS